jgi:hypothetical protein
MGRPYLSSREPAKEHTMEKKTDAPKSFIQYTLPGKEPKHAPGRPPTTTKAVGEEGGGGITSLAIGEEGGESR